ncbi:iron-containing redox enzyme family protein [Leptothermofonsia sichuanensis E412]|nr:iron-containing redox enzyme family protein [Leptothermofonsia sichuanensis E412]
MNPLSSSVMQSFRELTGIHPLWNHPFLVRCRTEQLTFTEVQILAVQMYKFSKEFNRILGGILSCCPDESAQLVILDNLFDEMGRGNPDYAHAELFRRFTRSLGIQDEMLAAIPPSPETEALVETYLKLPHQYGYLAALGAVCFASEGIVSTLYSQLYRGIVCATPLSQDALAFFEVHIDVDDGHAANLAAILEHRIATNEEAIEVNRAILEAMDARVQFFDGIQRQVMEAQSSMEPLLLASV